MTPPFGLDATTWAEIYKLLDIPLIFAVVAITFQIRTLVPPRWWPILPVAVAMAVAIIVPSSFPVTTWNFWRRVAVYGGCAAWAYNARKMWLGPSAEGARVAE